MWLSGKQRDNGHDIFSETAPEKCIEQQVPLYQVFVNRDALWKVFGKICCPPTFVNMIRRLHREIMSRLTFNDSLSEVIAVDNGVKQGDILAPTLFSVYFAALLAQALI